MAVPAREGRWTRITEAALRGIVSQTPNLRMEWPDDEPEPTFYRDFPAQDSPATGEGLREALDELADKADAVWEWLNATGNDDFRIADLGKAVLEARMALAATTLDPGEARKPVGWCEDRSHRRYGFPLNTCDEPHATGEAELGWIATADTIEGAEALIDAQLSTTTLDPGEAEPEGYIEQYGGQRLVEDGKP